MVYVNSKKFACESCIKGHRSSSCHHTDRPLFEIKKKGRPVSQCEKCRELRQSKKLHSKCTCSHAAEAKEATQPLVPSSLSKTRRFIPIVPALPNGLKDAFTQSSTSPPADERQRVDTLLNPCTCKSLWKCKCRARSTEKSLSQQPAACSGLLTLASAAAALECCSKSSSNPTQTSSTASVKRPARPRSLKISSSTSSKRSRQEKRSCVSAHSHNLQLPPLLYTSSSTSTSQDLSLAAMPDFGFMPPIDQIASLAGSGCTCGVQCACPSCAEHNQNGCTDTGKRNCADGCGTCIDPSLQFSLPSNAGAGSSTFPSLSQSSTSNHLGDKESFLDRFFACAAALPPPPERRKTLVHLDPMNTTVYSNKFGPPINLPKLDCCDGRCTCPGDQCSCTSSCLGCGIDKGEGRHTIITQPQEMAPVA